MKTTTILEAYHHAEIMKSHFESLHGIQGIAVETDHWSLEWQRYDRLSKTCWERLQKLANQLDEWKMFAKRLPFLHQ